MSSIYVFPGQGSQSVGMGYDLYKNNAEANAVFKEMDNALGENLSDIIFNGPIETLTLTANVQPAILATSVAMYRAANLPKPDYVAGHSLGEYTALCVAGAISLSDAIKLVRLRGESMQNAVPAGQGAMAVILGIEYDDLKSVCEQAEQETGLICDIANDNCPGQIVISGANDAIEKAIEIAKEHGARRAMKLALSVPPHSRLMLPVVDIMKNALDKIEIKEPIVPIISNKTCKPMTDIEEIKEALLYQITHGVRWRESVLNMVDMGITDLTEIGPGNALVGMVNRTTDKINAHKLEI
ncbi:MAG: ACP S-malonyltransferase [Alphaproteobacteria bacterium]|nr:ACP S-malonyltransferase [Alphaproteobacteria bacterium]